MLVKYQGQGFRAVATLVRAADGNERRQIFANFEPNWGLAAGGSMSRGFVVFPKEKVEILEKMDVRASIF